MPFPRRALLATLLFLPAGTERTQGARSNSLACTAVIPPSDSGSGRISVVAPGPDGRLAWTDGRPGQFLVRDRAGTVRVVGRTGAGPGEFRSIGNMGWIGDTLWIGDVRLARVQFFSDTGKFLRVVTALSPASWGARPDGSIAGMPGMPLAGPRQPIRFVSFREGATRHDTIAEFPPVPSDLISYPVADRTVTTWHPLQPATEVGLSADFARMCGATPDGANAVVLRCVDDRGRTLLDRRLTLEPRPVTDEIYDSVIQAYVGRGRTAADMRRRISRPRNLPLVLGVIVDDSGELWLQRSYRRESVVRWLRVRADGTVRDSVTYPATYNVIRTSGDTVWATTADSDGLQTLHRCRLRP